MEFIAKKQINWQLKALPANTQKALVYFSKQRWLRQASWYLAGGTALALHAGHRRSVDLDFFIQKESFNAIFVLKNFRKSIWKTSKIEEGAIHGELFNTRVSFIVNPLFIPAQKKDRFGYVDVLTPIDIAVMKIIAISQRGRKRDFYDLYWCAKNLEPLEKIISRLKKQYPSVAHDYHHILKSMIYFEHAKNDPAPLITFQVSWTQVKKFFQKEIPKITKDIINLR